MLSSWLIIAVGFCLLLAGVFYSGFHLLWLAIGLAAWSLGRWLGCLRPAPAKSWKEVGIFRVRLACRLESWPLAWLPPASSSRLKESSWILLGPLSLPFGVLAVGLVASGQLQQAEGRQLDSFESAKLAAWVREKKSWVGRPWSS